MAQTDTDPKPAATIGNWKKNKTHYVTLPSSTVVGIQIPDLPHLVKTEVIPNDLVDTAIAVAEKSKKVTREDIVKQSDFYDKLAAITVVEPKVTEEDFASGVLPFEDKMMIIELATKERDLDAIGGHIGGLDKVEEWRNFRAISAQQALMASL